MLALKILSLKGVAYLETELVHHVDLRQRSGAYAGELPPLRAVPGLRTDPPWQGSVGLRGPLERGAVNRPEWFGSPPCLCSAKPV